MPQEQSTFELFQNFLREMFQFDNNELDFGLFKVLRLKRAFIEQFINGDGEQDLRRIVSRELAAIRSADDADEKQWLANRCELLGIKTKKAWEIALANLRDKALNDALRQAVQNAEEDDKLTVTLERLDRWLQAQQHSTSHLEAQLYNYLLNFFELYYQNGDFGYNSRAASAFKVPYEADYDGADTLFHYKHKDCYYIKTANSFPEVRLDVQGKKLVFRVQAGGDNEATAQNNNKEADIKLYRLVGIAEQDGACVVSFQLARTGTLKTEIYPQLLNILGITAYSRVYLWQKDKDGEKPLFKELGRDHDKTEGGQVKGINQLRLSADSYLEALAKHDALKSLGRNAEDRQKALKNCPIAQALLQIDKALNRFYVGQDADYFIHKDLHGFLSREKDRFIKNVIFSDLDALLDPRADAATRVLARAFNAVAGRIIEFLDATETFQKNLFTLKKKVIDTHWLISLGKIPDAYWTRLLENPRLVAWWQSEFKQTVGNLDDLKARPTLVVDTSLFTTLAETALIDEILADPAFDHLDEQTDGLLIHSENWQALNLLQEKFRERIQCIYIDPPYNTGGDGFLYKDSFRHSSWAAMMADRLEQGRNLLSPTGCLFCSIDRDEQPRLVQVADQTFGPENFIEEIVWQKSYGGGHKTKHVNNLHEYVRVYAKDKENTPRFWLKPDPEVQKYYKYEDSKMAIRGRFRTQPLHTNSNDFRKNLTYPIPVPTAELGTREWEEGFFKIREWLRNDKLTIEPTDHGKTVSWKFLLDGSPWQGGLVRPEKQWQWAWETTREAIVEDNLVFSNGKNGIAVEYKQYEFGSDGSERGRKPASIQVGPYTQTGTSDLSDVIGTDRFKFPKPVDLICEFIGIGFEQANQWVLDFFAGSGTTAHSAISINAISKTRMRRFVLTEVGEHFSDVLKPRVSRILFSLEWKDGFPQSSDGWQGLIKVQRFEQYEDVVNALDTAWDEAALPEGVPLRYLFRPDQNRVRLSLNLARPFGNILRAGKQGEPRPVDLLETWALLQGYWIRSRKVVEHAGKRYAALESECGCLVLLRDIAEGEDDSASVNAIAAGYVNADGSRRIQRLELNHWADLRKIALPCTLLTASDFDRGATWN